MGRRFFCRSTIVAAILSAVGCQSLRTGDLLFHFTASDNAITAATGSTIDHVAVYIGSDSVIEAIPPRVTTTHLDSLIRRSPGYYRAARIHHVDRRQFIRNVRSLLQRDYDSLYLPDNDAIYCSELVVRSAVNRRGEKLFCQVPMTFRDSSGHIPPYFTLLYSRHGMKVPEGLDGSNPGELFARELLSPLDIFLRNEQKNYKY